MTARVGGLAAGARAVAPSWALVLLVSGAVLGVLLHGRPGPLPAPVAATPRPWLVAIEDLRLEAAAENPALRAARASPLDVGPLTLGGAVHALALEDVVVELRPGVELRARGGELAAERLVLGPDVRIERDGRRVLVAARVEVGAGGERLRFPGIVLLDPDGVREARRDVELTTDEILR